jgi:protein farnesyltransferase/geranylgeranyltransferase type-1 subunit alpha
MALFLLSDWHGVAPVPQDDGPDPVVTIAYSDEFRMLMGYFRAVLRTQEFSPRVLLLTSALLQHNAANYTVWQYRRDCLRELAADLNAELDYVDSFAEENPKNYQIWNHRRVIVETLKNASREKKFTEKVFGVDSKNYHAWAHRQWAIKTFDLWEGEIAFVETLLEADIRNNSAWNHRWFVVQNRWRADRQVAGLQSAPVSAEECEAELAFVWKALQVAKNNESAWNYLRGLAFAHLDYRGRIREMCDEMVSSSEGSNPLALGLCADLWEKEGSSAGKDKAAGYFALLINIDPMRTKVWRFRFDALKC